MKKHILLFTVLTTFSVNKMVAQVGINNDSPKATLDVTAKTTDGSRAEGMIAPRLTGDQLKLSNAQYTTAQTGTLIYAISAISSPDSTGKTSNITIPGYYYFNGNIWEALKSSQSVSSDATRFLGGYVNVRYQATNNTALEGTLSNIYVINGGASNYNVGTLAVTPSKGSVDSFNGDGFTISNPSPGIFDMKFNIPFTDIYGISVNVVDNYGDNTLSNGSNSNNSMPGSRLFTTENAQVAYIGNDIIRIKTGNNGGAVNNRSFTFLVTGK